MKPYKVRQRYGQYPFKHGTNPKKKQKEADPFAALRAVGNTMADLSESLKVVADCFDAVKESMENLRK